MQPRRKRRPASEKRRQRSKGPPIPIPQSLKLQKVLAEHARFRELRDRAAGKGRLMIKSDEMHEPITLPHKNLINLYGRERVQKACAKSSIIAFLTHLSNWGSGGRFDATKLSMDIINACGSLEKFAQFLRDARYRRAGPSTSFDHMDLQLLPKFISRLGTQRASHLFGGNKPGIYASDSYFLNVNYLSKKFGSTDALIEFVAKVGPKRFVSAYSHSFQPWAGIKEDNPLLDNFGAHASAIAALARRNRKAHLGDIIKEYVEHLRAKRRRDKR